MKRQTVIRSALAAAVVLAVAGCASRQSSAPAASAGPAPIYETYRATLSPNEEVPPAANSRGTGTAEVRVNIRDNSFTWKTTHSGTTGPVTMGHIHGPAAPGANAGVVVPFQGVEKPSAEGSGKLTAAQYGDLAAGLYYVNLHTAQYPGGELRGQLRRQ